VGKWASYNTSTPHGKQPYMPIGEVNKKLKFLKMILKNKVFHADSKYENPIILKNVPN